uniref:Sulfotransferase domain-containing protein n=1 Tax=viral metagenome TaxID=1070528 RepID=A0A6C0GZD6_9ZZZZ
MENNIEIKTEESHIYDVFVFCGGKCGGVTIANTLQKNGFIVLHMHSLKYSGMNDCKFDPKNIYNEMTKSCNNKQKVYFIDCYRNPIERKISSFFQNIENYLPNYENMDIDELIDNFNRNFYYIMPNNHPINSVFKYYNLPNFTKFDFENRYNILENKNQIFIKILFKDIKNWNNILSKIFKKNIIIYSKNETLHKNIGLLYKHFLNNYKIPTEFIDDILENDKEFTIYNTPEEQTNYINEWLLKSY